MKTYEIKLLDQLLHGQELIIKRNGYYLTIWYNKKKRHLHLKRDGDDTCYIIHEAIAEEFIALVKSFINIKYEIGLHYLNNSWYLQKDGTWTDDWGKADNYYKKPDMDYVVEKAKQKAIDFINENQLKIDKRKCFNLLVDRNCINIMKLL